jgi:hypothetical protein
MHATNDTGLRNLPFHGAGQNAAAPKIARGVKRGAKQSHVVRLALPCTCPTTSPLQQPLTMGADFCMQSATKFDGDGAA